MEIRMLGHTLEVVYIRKRIKRTYLRINRKMQLLITSPSKLSEKDLNELIEKHKIWISKQLALLNETIIDKHTFLFFGKPYTMEEEYTNNPLGSPFVQPDTWVHEGCRIVTQMFDEALTTHTLFGRPTLVFRLMVSRWGVCHYHHKKIVLNQYLIHLPKELIHYVIYHELSHLIHPNHSRDFYACLQAFHPNYRADKALLRTYRHLLYETQN